jgi:hypothetical protein
MRVVYLVAVYLLVATTRSYAEDFEELSIAELHGRMQRIDEIDRAGPKHGIPVVLKGALVGMGQFSLY